MFVPQIQNDWYSLARDDSRCIVRLRRTSRRHGSPAELEQSFAGLFVDMERVLPADERGRYGLLQDMRAAPRLDSPELEALMRRLVTRLAAGWRRRAIVVQTPIGKLQARRTVWTNAQDGGVEIFSDEIEALNYLQSGG